MSSEKISLDFVALRADMARRVLAPNRDSIIDAWARCHRRVDIDGVMSGQDFRLFCEREVDRLVQAFLSRDYTRYFSEMAGVGADLAQHGVSFAGVINLVHYLEHSYIDDLVAAYDEHELAQVLVAVDEFMHDMISQVAASYFNNVKERMAEQMAAAKVLETAIRPPDKPESKALDIGVKYMSATGHALVGGDFYDFFDVPDGKLAITIGDVSGKGIDAAADGVMTKFVLRALAFEDPEPASVIPRVNRVVRAFLRHDFVTLVYALFNPESGVLRFANAGHQHAVLQRRKSRDCSFVETTDKPLGVFESVSCAPKDIELASGDLLFFYTDGLPEARRNGEFFGYDRVINIINGREFDSAQECVDTVFEHCITFARGFIKDDLAIVAVRRR